jgi:hypothetical protein
MLLVYSIVNVVSESRAADSPSAAQSCLCELHLMFDMQMGCKASEFCDLKGPLLGNVLIM